MDSWRAKSNKTGSPQSKTETTVNAVTLHIPAASSHPFMLGTVGPVNPNVVNALKKIRSPNDGWTYAPLRWCSRAMG